MTPIVLLAILLGMARPPAVAGDGQAAEPQAGSIYVSSAVVAWQPGLTLMTALSSNYSTEGWGSFSRRVRLIRDGKVMIIDQKKIRAGKVEDIKLQPGDSVQIPHSMFE